MYANSDDCGSNASFFQFLHVHVWCIAQVIYVSDFIKKKSVPKKLTKGVPFLKKKNYFSRLLATLLLSLYYLLFK